MENKDLQNLLDSLDEGPLGKRKDYHWDQVMNGTSHLNTPDIQRKSQLNKRKSNGKPVNQYSLKGKFICRYDCIIEAQEKLNKRSNLISEAINGRLNQAHGYIWIEDGKDTPKAIKLAVSKAISKKKRQLGQYTLEGKLVKVHESLAAAYREYGYSIRDYLEGKTKHAYNHKWEYYN